MPSKIRVTLFYQQEKAYAYFLSHQSLRKNYQDFLYLSHKKWPIDVFFINRENSRILPADKNCSQAFLQLRLLGISGKK